MERVPSARLIGAIELAHHRLLFHKRSVDGSSKCNLLQTGLKSDVIYGALYAMDPAQKQALDRAEGKCYGYVDSDLKVQHQGREYTCFTYLAQPSYIVDNWPPYHWYKQLVVLGARYLQFPEEYVNSLASVESVDDPVEPRRKKHEALIEKLICVNREKSVAG